MERDVRKSSKPSKHFTQINGFLKNVFVWLINQELVWQQLPPTLVPRDPLFAPGLC